MVGAGNNNSDLPFACPTPSQAGRAPMKRNGEGAKKRPGGGYGFRGQCVRARWRMRTGRDSFYTPTTSARITSDLLLSGIIPKTEEDHGTRSIHPLWESNVDKPIHEHEAAVR